MTLFFLFPHNFFGGEGASSEMASQSSGPGGTRASGYVQRQQQLGIQRAAKLFSDLRSRFVADSFFLFLLPHTLSRSHTLKPTEMRKREAWRCEGSQR